MKITRIGPSFPLLTASTLGGGGGSITPSVGSGLVPVSTGSNSWAWGSNVSLITAAGSNVLGPFVNFAAGSNVTLTVDQSGAIASNTIRIHATTGAASFGSNSNAVSLANAPGASTDSSRADHVHLGVTSLAHSSNTYSGPVILAPGTNMAITSPVAGTFTLHSSGAGGGGSGAVATDAIWDVKGDLAGGTGANTAARLAVGANATVLTADSAEATGMKWAAAAGGGVSWVQDITESGTSFANFTAGSGTWASDGTTINQTAAGGTYRAAHNTLAPLGFGFIIEVEVYFVTTATGAIRAGILVGKNGAVNSPQAWIYLEKQNQVIVEREGVVQARIYATTINSTTWYKLRIVSTGSMISVYLAGVLLGTAQFVTGDSEAYPSLGTYEASAKFRNFKVWTLSGGLPA